MFEDVRGYAAGAPVNQGVAGSSRAHEANLSL